METKIDDIIEILDKKIKIKEIRIRGRNKTFVEGLDTYDEFKDIENIKKLSKEIKNKYGCACTLLEEGNQKNLIFQGNHKQNIKNYLKEKYPKLLVE